MTIVTIVGDGFHLNGRPTYEGRAWQGRRVEGLLMNSRMVQAIFDDGNPETRQLEHLSWAFSLAVVLAARALLSHARLPSAEALRSWVGANVLSRMNSLFLGVPQWLYPHAQALPHAPLEDARHVCTEGPQPQADRRPRTRTPAGGFNRSGEIRRGPRSWRNCRSFAKPRFCPCCGTAALAPFPCATAADAVFWHLPLLRRARP